MTIRYCDQTLGSGLNNGTSWANAYQSMETAAAALASGDTLYVQHSKNYTGGNKALLFPYAPNIPPWVIGCKPGTTAEPPAQSDLIPGLFTGAGTRAYDDANVPVFNAVDAGAWMRIDGSVRMYGIHLQADYLIALQSGAPFVLAEECMFKTLNHSYGLWGWYGTYFGGAHFKNCKTDHGSAGCALTAWSTMVGTLIFEGHLHAQAGATAIVQTYENAINVEVRNSDFSANTSLVAVIRHWPGTQGGLGQLRVIGCKLPSGAVGVDTPLSPQALEPNYSILTGLDGSAKTAGQSYLDARYTSYQGTVTTETTAVRTGGASDGATGAFSFALAPTVNRTAELVRAVSSPWVDGWVAGDGNNKTLTVYVANDGGSNLQNDEVSMEVHYPSASGGHKMEVVDTRCQIGAAPANLTTDTSSWGGSAANPQKMTATIAPDFSGPIRWRVHFWKAYAASPKTLFVDPIMEIA